jgi:Putative transposase/Transposase zinc-binding domain
VIELADVLARHWPAYEQRFGNKLLPSHRAAVRAILSCRTPQLGGQTYRCADCGHTHYAYHSCGHRACPKCGNAEAADWNARQQTRLLPGIAYFLVTFTVPAELRTVIRSHQKELCALLFRESAAPLQEVAAKPKYLGAQLGMLGVLHTWSRQLVYHPHVHYVVAGAGLSADGLRWKRVASDKFFLPQKVLARRFRNRLRRALALDYPDAYRQIPAAVWRADWVVDCLAVGSGQAALKYLAAYVYKTALSSARILADDERGVTVRFRRSDDGRWQTLPLAPAEFLRRFLQHVLPRGFQRVRCYGWLAPAAKEKWRRIEALLDWKRPEPPPSQPLPVPECPRCRKPMALVERLPRAPP